MLNLILAVGIPALLLGFGIFVGGYRERRHITSLDRREAETKHVLVTNLKRIPDEERVDRATLVDGEVVIATDYFKSFATAMRNLFGGEMRAAQSLMTRARREALLRMIEQAQALGAQEVWNVRFAFSNITQMSGNKGAIAVEIYAYGTAVVRK
jgi:uncharacterized protein YbjQ (UPF0145 family)